MVRWFHKLLSMISFDKIYLVMVFFESIFFSIDIKTYKKPYILTKDFAAI